MVTQKGVCGDKQVARERQLVMATQKAKATGGNGSSKGGENRIVIMVRQKSVVAGGRDGDMAARQVTVRW